MAAQAKGKSRPVRNFKVFLEKLDKDLHQNKTDDLCKTIRKDNNMFKTFSDLRDLMKKEVSEIDLLESEKGKLFVSSIRRSQAFDKLPEDVQQLISVSTTEEKNPVDKKQDVKNPPMLSSGEDSNTENKSVDVGSAQVSGEDSNTENKSVDVGSAQVQLPSTTNKQRPGKEAETENQQEKIQKLQKELEEERKKAAELHHKFDDRGKQINGLEKDIKEKEKEMKFLDEESKNLAKSLGQEKKTRTAVENELKSAKDMVQRLEKHVNDDFVKCQEHQKRIAELEAANKKLEAANKNLDKQKYHMEQQANKNMEHMQNILLEEKRKADDQYKKLLADRDDLRDRFSKLAGKKLQEQNADIADLSDPNRAMKVSEKFGQLYDDDWTNAFESLTDKKLGVPLKDAINVLLRLLQECWTFCNKLVAAQMESLQNVFLHPAQILATFDQKKTGLTDRPRITSKDQPSLNDLRKRVGVSPPVIEEVKQALLADSKTWDKREEKKFDKKHIEACTPYIQKCAEVCWLMALHDPPLLMKMDVKQDEKFDTNIYTVYSQSGQTIDFLVWPPLYNGRDGGLLSKGVAEPIRVVSKKK